MSVSAVRTERDSNMHAVSPHEGRYSGDDDVQPWNSIEGKPTSGRQLSVGPDDSPEGELYESQKHQGGIAWFFAHFAGPIVWAMEVATVLLIIAFHSKDFVSVVVVVNLIIIVLMMAFKSSLGFRQQSQSDNKEEALSRPSAARLRAHQH